MLILFTTFNSCGQNRRKFENGTYSVDSRIKDTVNMKLASIDKGFSIIDYKTLWNDSLRFDSGFNKGSNISRTKAILSNDTIKLFCGLRDWLDFGFQIYLFNDTCIVKHFNASNNKIYKSNKSDSLINKISIGCKSYKLTLANKPKFKKGEILEGKIELISNEYYVWVEKEEKRCEVILIGYFKTELFQNMKNDSNR
jgi:hypothetical protein